MPEGFDNYMWNGSAAGRADEVWGPSSVAERRPAKWYGDGIYEQDGRWYVMGYNPNGEYADRSVGREIDDARGGFGSMSDAELAANEMWYGMNPDFRYDPESQSWNASEIVNYGDDYPYGLPKRGDRYRYNFSTPDDVWFENGDTSEYWDEVAHGIESAEERGEPNDEWRKSVKKGDVYYDPFYRGYRICGTGVKVHRDTLDPELAEDLAQKSGNMFIDEADVNPNIVQFSDLAKVLQDSGIEYEPVRDKYDRKKYYENGGHMIGKIGQIGGFQSGGTAVRPGDGHRAKQNRRYANFLDSSKAAKEIYDKGVAEQDSEIEGLGGYDFGMKSPEEELFRRNAIRTNRMLLDKARGSRQTGNLDRRPPETEYSRELSQYGTPMRERKDAHRNGGNIGNVMRYTVYFKDGGLLPRSQRRTYQTGSKIGNALRSGWEYVRDNNPISTFIANERAKRDMYAYEGLEDFDPDVNPDLDPEKRDYYDSLAQAAYDRKYENYYKDKVNRYRDKVKGYFGRLKGGPGVGGLDKSTSLDRYMVPHIGQEEIDEYTKM